MTGCPESVTRAARTPAVHPALLAGSQFPGAGRAYEVSAVRATLLELSAMPSAVPCARLHARNVMAEWGMSAIARTAELLVSELVTNAITASPGSVVTMRLTAGVNSALIEVHDPSPRMPELQDLEEDTEHGRGLVLVTILSAEWGVQPIPGRGKVVWCVLGRD